jgi:RHS repeat-associated protein
VNRFSSRINCWVHDSLRSSLEECLQTALRGSGSMRRLFNGGWNQGGLFICGVALAACSRQEPQEAPVAATRAALQPAGLVAAYAFDEGMGVTVSDASGNSNDGTLSDAVTWTPSGKHGGAASFSNAWITVNENSDLDLTTGMTAEAWVNPTTMPAFAAVVAKETPDNISYGLFASDTSNDDGSDAHPHAWVLTADGLQAAATDGVLPLHQWTHIAATYDNSTLKYYINGALAASADIQGPILTGDAPLRIGGDAPYGGESFDGVIDDVRVYNRALSVDEIGTDMLAPVAPGLCAGVIIDDGNSCTADACDPSTGNVTHTPLAVGASCSDGNACNGAETCDASVTCIAGTPPTLDDGNPCTADACDPSRGVTHSVIVGPGCSGLVVAYSFDDGAGVIATDTSGSGNDGTLSDGVSWSALGKHGGAGSFSGGWVTVNQNSTVDLTSGMTLEAWVNLNSPPGFTVVAAKETPDAIAYGLYAADTNGGGDEVPHPAAWVLTDNGLNATFTDGFLPTNEWTHIAATYDNSTLSYYINGVLASSTSVAGPIAIGDGPFRVGGDSPYGGEFFDGLIDDVRLYSHALTADEIGLDMVTPVGSSSGDCSGATVDDGNPCTVDACDSTTGNITHTPVATGTSCSDGNICNGAETCNASAACVAGTPPSLDDGNPCTTDACDATAGVTHTPVATGTSCSDGNICNGAETCNASAACVAGTPPSVDDGNPCTADTCDPSAGVIHAPVAQGTGCSDGNACNGTESCDGNGICLAGVPPSVDDGNVCTSDACDPALGVTHTPVATGTSCSDGNVCNGAETCNASGACSAGSPLNTDDGNPCTVDSCDPTAGVRHTPASAGTSCSDGNACNGSETCNGSGACVPGTPPTVDDGDPCTVDACDAQGIHHSRASVGTSCDPKGDACKGGRTCDASGACVASDPPVVDDGNPCTVDSCDATTGVHHTQKPTGATCGDHCFGFGTCSSSGACQVTTQPDFNVDDQDPCTDDSCNSNNEEQHTPTPAGTLCAGDYCDSPSICTTDGKCVPGTPNLDDGNPCTDDVCTSSGVVHPFKFSGTPCGYTGSNPCEGILACDGFGSCSEPRDIDDGNPCTTDSCDPTTGVHNVAMPVGSACGDGNPCFNPGTCDDSGFCNGEAPVNVSDGNDCTVDTCQPDGTITHDPASVGTACNFGANPCVFGACSASGTCEAGGPIDVDDGNPCTIDACDPSQGQSHTPVADGTQCGPGDSCTAPSTCFQSTCISGEPLTVPNDGNPCTVDTCDPTTGPIYPPAVAGTNCSDGKRCNGTETCDGAGACQPGTPPVIDDGNPCTTDLCSEVAGIEHIPAVNGTSCSDGNRCNGLEQCQNGQCTAGIALPTGSPCDTNNVLCDGETCNAASQCVMPSGPVSYDDGNPCTIDVCDPVYGVSHQPAPAGTSCDTDSTVCNGSAVCDGNATCVPVAAPVVDDGNPCTVDFCSPDKGALHLARAGATCGTNLFCDALGGCVPIPPDPTAIAPKVDSTVTTTVFESTSFLYTGANPIQREVPNGQFTRPRAALIRGVVLDTQGAGVPAVAVSFLGHPEFGSTLTRQDGHYDLVANGGDTLTLQFANTSFLPAQRSIFVPWQGGIEMDPVVLTIRDPVVSTIDFSGALVAQSSISSDSNGSRRATLLFQEGTQARLELPDGSEEPLNELHVRLTEYTVGDSGPRAMPGNLPPASGYTHALELSADEESDAMATGIKFDRPAALYLDNYRGFPVGSAIPIGYYDSSRAAWIGADDGVVLRLLSVDSGMAALDVDGSGHAAGDAVLAAIGITPTEQQTIASLFAPGASFSRVSIEHFSEIDDNGLLVSNAPDATYPAPPVGPEVLPSPDKNKCQEPGCVLEVEKQALTESVPLAGTPYSLVYSSRLVPGYASQPVKITLTSGAPPPSLLKIELDINVAGAKHTLTFPPSPNLTYNFMWDGLDPYGRPVYGQANASFTIRYFFPAVYALAKYDPQTRNWDIPGIPAGTIPGLPSIYERTWESTLGAPLVDTSHWDARGVGLGGWNIDVHNTFDPSHNATILGTGSIDEDLFGPSINTIAGLGTGGCCNGGTCSDDGGPAALTKLYQVDNLLTMPDGSLLVIATIPSCNDTGPGAVLRRINPDGTISTLAADGKPNNTFLPADFPQMALGPRGSVYMYTERMLYRMTFPTSSTYSLEHVGGVSEDPNLHTPASDGDNIPALSAWLQGGPPCLAVAPDGTVFVCDRNRVRQIGTDGIIRTIVGTGADPLGQPSGDGGPAIQAVIDRPWALALGPDGSLYLGSQDFGSTRNPPGWPPTTVRRVSPQGIISTIAGRAVAPGQGVVGGGDGGLATQAELDNVVGIVPSPDSGLYVETGTAVLFGRVRHINASGTITNVAGDPSATDQNPSTLGDGGPAATARFTAWYGFQVDHQGNLILGTYEGTIRKVSPAAPGAGTAPFSVASKDRALVYDFDERGRQLSTSNAATGAQLLNFSYDSTGALSEIKDAFGNTTQIVHDAFGHPQRVIAPFGQVTELAVDSNGYLNHITDPTGAEWSATYTSSGLMTAVTDRRGGSTTYAYDDNGLLLSETDQVNATKTLSSTITPSSSTSSPATRTVVLATGQGYDHSYQFSLDSSGSDTTQVTMNGVTSTLTIDGSETTRLLADGSQITSTSAGDPVFGMQAPYEGARLEVLPSGLTRALSRTRTAVGQSSGFTEVMVQNGAQWSSSFDPTTNTFTQTSPELRQAVRTLNPQGQVTRVVTEGIEPVDFFYDSNGRLDHTNTGTGALARTTRYGYTSAGYLQSVTDASTDETTFTRDALGRTLTEARAGISSTFTWDGESNLASLTPPGKPAHGMTYTPVNLLATYVPPSAGLPLASTSYTYDADHMLRTETRPDGLQVVRTPDGAGRLSTVQIPGGMIQYNYYPAGTASGAGQASDILGPYGTNLHFMYDGSLTTSTTSSGDVTGTISFSYDNDFNKVVETVNNRGTTALTAFGYDRDQLLTCASPTTCNPPGSDALTLGRNSAGLVSTLALGGTTETVTYNAFGELARQTATFGATPLLDITYDAAGVERDSLGRIVQKTEVIGGATNVYHYTYDHLRRLTDVTLNGSLAEHFEYDANGNRTLATNAAAGTSYTGTYDDQDRLLSYGPFDFTYTANGELETKKNRTTGEEWIFDYDALGNLLSVGLPNGDLVEYLVDGMGRRVGKKKNGTLLKQWLYHDALKPVAELDGSGNLVSQFVYGSKGNVPDYVRRGGNTYRVISDQLGSPRYVVNVANANDVPFTASYTSFGVATGTGLDWIPFGFAGGIYDADSGQIRFGARDFDFASGRWLTKDPLRFAGSRNLYLYVADDPVNSVDPTGLMIPTRGPDPIVAWFDEQADSWFEIAGENWLNGDYAAAIGPAAMGAFTEAVPDAIGWLMGELMPVPGCITRIERHGPPPIFKRHAHGTTGRTPNRGEPWTINEDGTAHDGNYTRIPKDDAEELRQRGFDVPEDRYPR